MSPLNQLSLRASPAGTLELQSALDSFDAILSDNQRQELELLKSQPDAAAVLEFTTLLDKQNAKRQSRCIATRVQTVLASVQQFSTVIETFVSSDPKIAALLWGSVKFTLVLASEFGSYFDKLSALFMNFGRHCPRYAEYQSLYLDSAELQSKLCKFYSALVSFCTKAVQVIQRSGLTQLALTVFSSFESEFSDHEQKLRYWSKEIKGATDLAAQKAADRERRAQSEERGKAKRSRRQEVLHRRIVEKFISESDNSKLQMEKARSLQQKQRLLERLSDFDYARPWTRARRQCISSTSQWLTKTEGFQNWMADATSSLLWFSGKLGSGKTVLTAGMIAELFCRGPTVERIAYFFCQFDNEASLRATTILSSLLKQILRPEDLSPAQQSCLEQLNRGPLEMEDLELLLQEAISTSKRQLFVIDAIDECTQSERNVLLTTLKRVMELPDRTVKFFISSRDGNDRHIRSTCQSVHLASTDSPESKSSMKIVIKKKLDELVEDGALQLGNPNIRHEIEDHLLSKADGMFLWVDFQLQDICSQATDYDIRAALQHLPTGLPDTYDRLLGKIHKSGKKELVQKILRWIACAKRPLSLEELREAISIEPLQQSSEPDRYVNDMAQIPSWCHGLAICDEEDNALQFAHSSIKEFLLGDYRTQANSDFHFVSKTGVNHISPTLLH